MYAFFNLRTLYLTNNYIRYKDFSLQFVHMSEKLKSELVT